MAQKEKCRIKKNLLRTISTNYILNVKNFSGLIRKVEIISVQAEIE